MKQNSENASAMLDKLVKLREDLGLYRVLLSEAILALCSVLRGSVPEERINWLNRELLGYKDGELVASGQKLFATTSIDGALDHRKVSGVWGYVSDVERRATASKDPTLDELTIVTGVGIEEVENLIGDYVDITSLKMGAQSAERAIDDGDNGQSNLDLHLSWIGLHCVSFRACEAVSSSSRAGVLVH